jgi:putative oxidoreductase
VLRLAVFVFLIHDALRASAGSASLEQQVPSFIAAGLGVFLIVGLWTPIAGILAALVELWIAGSQLGELWPCLLAALIACSLAMLGPGAWSLDAHYFGRKRISIPHRE